MDFATYKKDLAITMNELSLDLQEKASIFISEISRYTTQYGVFHSELTKYTSLDPDDTCITICFTGIGLEECDGLAIEALYNETDIPKLARYCVMNLLKRTLLHHMPPQLIDLNYANNVNGSETL